MVLMAVVAVMRENQVGIDLFLSSSKNSFILAPSYGKKPSRKFLTTTVLALRLLQKKGGAGAGFLSRARPELNTTQVTSRLEYCESSRKMVPPQPISMSSECAPRHKIFRARLGPRAI